MRYIVAAVALIVILGVSALAINVGQAVEQFARMPV